MLPVEEGAHAFHRHHLSVFGGIGFEQDGDHREEGFAVGLEYAFGLTPLFSVGVVLEALGQDTLRNALVLFPLTLRPVEHWRLVTGPGVELGDEADKLVYRIGGGYEFPLRGGFTIGPELFVDFIEGGAFTGVVGLALGYGF